MCDISFIVPVYNTEEFLPKCLDSLLAQTVANFEVLVVNDGSPGDCREIMGRYTQRYQNIVYVEHGRNRSVFQARLTGLRRAKGEYIAFVDSDDWASNTLYAELLETARQGNFDIADGRTVTGVEDNNPHPFSYWQHYHTCTCTEEIILSHVSGNISTYLWAKIVKSSILRKIVCTMNFNKEMHLNNNEDQVLLYILLSVANSYIKIETKGFYFYKVNEKSITKSIAYSEDIYKIIHDVKTVKELIFENIYLFINDKVTVLELEKKFLQDLRWLYEDLINVHIARNDYTEYVGRLFESINEGLSIKYHHNTLLPILPYYYRQKKIYRKRPIKNVAFFIEGLSGGGAERVVADLARMLQEQGYSVLLFMEKYYLEHYRREHSYKSNGIKIGLPSDLSDRWKAIKAVCQEYTIDACIFNSHWSYQNLLDITATQSYGAYTVMIEHNQYFFPVYCSSTPQIHKLFYLRHDVYKNLDALVCLSETQAAMWRASGIDRAFYIPNPLTFSKEAGQLRRSSRRDAQLLFVGRMVRHKGYMQLPYILLAILREVPSARLTMVGAFETEEDKDEFMALIRELGLEDAIQMVGFTDNIGAYYEKARVILIPSLFESWSMVLVEAKQHGVPAVLYEMKYLAPFLMEGSVMVGKEDMKGMAAAAIQLLRDDDLWREMSEKAYHSLDHVSNESVMQRWLDLFRALEKGEVDGMCRARESVDSQELMRIMLTEVECCARLTDEYIRHLSATPGAAELAPWIRVIDKISKALLPPGTRRRAAAKFVTYKILGALSRVVGAT